MRETKNSQRQKVKIAELPPFAIGLGDRRRQENYCKPKNRRERQKEYKRKTPAMQPMAVMALPYFRRQLFALPSWVPA